MRRYVCFAFIFFYLIGGLRAQDLIILKKTETSIPCRIQDISDTLITYFPESNPKLLQWVRRPEVLSFVINANPPKGKGRKKRKPLTTDPRVGLWGVYYSGEQVEGYIVRSNGDTITGLLRIANPALNQMQVDFQGNNEKATIYSVEDTSIISYGYGTVHYRKVKTRFTRKVSDGLSSPSGLLFLHIVVDGPARLYHYNTVNYPNNLLRSGNGVPPLYFAHIESHYVMINPSGRMMLTRNRSIKGTVNRLLSDYQDLMERIRLKGFKKAEVITVFEEYNDWYRKANPQSIN